MLSRGMLLSFRKRWHRCRDRWIWWKHW